MELSLCVFEVERVKEIQVRLRVLKVAMLLARASPALPRWVFALHWRERGIYIFPWLKVHITGPSHHLASSLRIIRRDLT